MQSMNMTFYSQESLQNRSGRAFNRGLVQVNRGEIQGKPEK